MDGLISTVEAANVTSPDTYVTAFASSQQQSIISDATLRLFSEKYPVEAASLQLSASEKPRVVVSGTGVVNAYEQF